MWANRVLTLTAGLALAIPALAGTPEPVPLLLEGDRVAGVGNVTRIDNLAVNDGGDWLVEADTNFSDSNADQVLIKSGLLFLRENDTLPLPVGATLDSFDSINLNAGGNSGWNFFLDSGLPSSEDSGIYFNTSLLIQESDISTAPEFSPGTPYIGFFDVKINAGNQLLVVASIDDPGIPGTVNRALVLLTLSPQGALISESVLAKEGDLLPGQTAAIDDFGTGPHESDFNNGGQVLYQVEFVGSTSNEAIYLDDLLLAQEGQPSPVAGRNYQFLGGRGLDLNNAGQFAFKANLDGDSADDDLIVVDGAVFVREGDSLPAIGGFQLTSFGSSSGPVQVADNGSVLWYGDWNDPNTDVDTGLFLNDQLIVQEGVTTVGGIAIDSISNGSDAFALSDNGRFIVFEATLEGGINGAFRIELEVGGDNQPPVAVCQDVSTIADASCTADVSVDAGSFDPDGDPLTLSQSPPGPYAIGSTQVTLTVSDGRGGVDSCTATVTVVDVNAPQLSVELTPDTLWPPNHRLVEVTATVTATDDCSVVDVLLDSATSDEPDNGVGDGNTVDDVQLGADPFTLWLRAERAGGGDGRVYTIAYSGSDSSGNTAVASATVVVPHDQGGIVEPVMLTAFQAEGGTAIGWTAVDGALHYNVIRGTLSQIVEEESAINLGETRCIEAQAASAGTTDWEDNGTPEPGEVFFYVVEYFDGASSSFGTESAPKPRVVGSGGCD